jgi:hypothetical protein
MLGAPQSVICPNPSCNSVVMTRFNDYDIECGNPNPQPGVWVLDCYCSECEREWSILYKVELQKSS